MRPIIIASVLFVFYILNTAFFVLPVNNVCADEETQEEIRDNNIRIRKEDNQLHETNISDLTSAGKKLTLINQNNEPVILDSLIGKPLVMSFIFTRCSSPTMCPLIMKKVAQVQKELNKEYKDKVFFAIFTFDPEYDTPAVLKKYGESYGVNYDNLIYLTGKKIDMDKALTHFRVYAKEEAPGEISHTMETMVLDEKGVIKRIFPTSIWSPKSVVNEVKKVVANWESRINN
ncbi:MAG: SCO family protein [Candidatus Anammoxibacter sp.]